MTTKETSVQDKIHPLFAQGRQLATELFGRPDGDFFDIPLPEGDDLKDTLVTWLFGYLLKERTQLTVRTKALAIVAMCTATCQSEMLERWIPAARNAGCTRVEVQETIVTMLVYAGWPAARNGLDILARAWPADAPAASA